MAITNNKGRTNTRRMRGRLDLRTGATQDISELFLECNYAREHNENLSVANAETDLLNQRHALHENYTHYGYRSFSRSHERPRCSG
jgi:hypothetical protein